MAKCRLKKKYFQFSDDSKNNFDLLCLLFGRQNRVAVKRLHCDHKDLGLNPTTTGNENQTLGLPLYKVAQWSGQDLSERPVMLSRTRPVEKQKQKQKEMPGTSCVLHIRIVSGHVRDV